LLRLEPALVKTILLVVLQVFKFAVFLGVLFAGGNWDGVNLWWKMQQMQRGNFHPSALLMPAIVHQLNPQQFLIANGLIYATILLVLILLYEVVRKKLKPWAFFTLGEYAVAMIIALTVSGWTIHAL
jgi:hypothetical protein